VVRTSVSAHEELIDSRIEVHDSNQFEVKLDYSIDPALRENRYHIEAYFFVPRSLGINSYTYSRDQFYSDIQAYIRFKTPELSLGSLLEPENRRSPLVRIKKFLARALENPKDHEALEEVSHELRLLGCLMRANIRDRVAGCSRTIATLRGKVKNRTILVSDVRTTAETLLRDIERTVHAFRDMRPSFLDPVLPLWIREVYAYVDEYLSLVIESHLTVLIDEIDHNPELKSLLAETRAHVSTTLLSERDHRVGCGYLSVLEEGSREHFVYRQGMLKKFVMSVLFLDINKEKEGRRVGDLIAAIAAGIAMLFATGAALWSQTLYGLNSFPFIIALVLSYMAKDRMKEWLKIYFSKQMTRWLSDYNVEIKDPTNDITVGRCREAFAFIDPKQVPKEIMSRRRSDATASIEAESKPEVVMKYGKDVVIRSATIAQMHGRLHDVNDIIRFNVSAFLARMDDPIRTVRAFNRDDDRIEEYRCPKTYHVNIVFVLKAQRKGTPVAMERVRVILDKNGIRALQQVP
jgi:hypothetical protein